MQRTKIKCEKCDKYISASNIKKHTRVCVGVTKKKIRGIDFDPNHGFKDGTRTAWNKGASSEKRGKRNEYYWKLRHNTPTEKLGYEALRVRIMEEQEFKCNNCGLLEWLGKPIALELEHIDGNNKNNKRENLEILCPNCHAMTPTWRGRNNKRHCDPASEGAELITQ